MSRVIQEILLTNNVHKCSQEKGDVDQDEHEALHGGEHSHGGEDAGPGGGHLNHVPKGRDR